MTAPTTRVDRLPPARRGVPPLVGRDAEVAAVVEAVIEGRVLVTLEGEPGVGKTRLIQEVLGRLGSGPSARRGLIVSFPALQHPAPLGSVVEGVKRLAPDVQSLGLSGLAGALRPLFPEWAEQLPAAPEPLDQPSAVRHRLYRALTELIEALGVEYVVLEDAHWADPATLEWLLMLHSRAPWGRRSVVVTYRPWDIPDDSLLPRLIGRVPSGMARLRIQLQPLGPAQIEQMVSSIYDSQQVSEAFAQFLFDVTDGVPLAVVEYLLLLEDREDILESDGQWRRRSLSELSVPVGVRESVLERVQRLDSPTKRILQAACIDPEPAGEDLLAAIAQVEQGQVRDAVAHALGCGLLQERGPGRFAFRHMLDAQAIRESLPASERRRLHANAARELANAEHPPVTRLARHYRHAGDLEQWSRAAEESARVALESGDDRTAVETLLQVIALDEPIERQVALARRLAEAAFFSADALGDLDQSVVDTLRRVLAATGIPRADRGELALHLGRMLWQRGQWENAFEQWERATDDLGDRPELAIRAMSNMGMPLIPSWQVSRHRHWLERAGEFVDQVGAHDRLAHLHMRISSLLLMGDQAGWDELQQLPEFGSDPEQDRDLTTIMANAALAILAWGWYAEAGDLLDTARRRMQRLDYGRMQDIIAVAEARHHWYTGRWSGLVDRVRRIAESPDPDSSTRLHARQLHAVLGLAGGAGTAARAELDECARQLERLGLVSPGAMVVPAALGRLHLAVGDVASALAAVAPTVEMITRKRLWFWLADVADVYVTAMLLDGHQERACAFVADFADHLGDRNLPAPHAALQTCHAVITAHGGSHRQAAEQFEHAARMWSVLPRPHDELLCLERAAQQLLADGDSAAGVETLTDIHQRLHDLGATWDADRIARELREHGHEMPRTWRGGRRGYGDTLSPREIEVVQLVAQGHTNQQVADALFIARRTVEGHVSSAMRKLDVSSRTALAVAALEAGITLRPTDGPVPAG